jgi:glyoxylase-like metal-dependent hydrolase (beta-lactamase superfamily II)
MNKYTICLSLLFYLIQPGCSTSETFKVMGEVTGPYRTNCYLIYGTRSREAALIDPGWRIDTLVSFIKDNNLDLKYIFITHGHSDHYYYVPELKRQFPKVRWGVNIEDFEKVILCPDWPVKAYGKESVENKRKKAEENVYLDFEAKSVGKPDFFVEGDQTYKLGAVKIKTIHTPGHSPGGICYYTDNILFSGDMLLYRSVGNLDFLTSNTEAFIKSVRGLYRLFPDSTIVYPGHNQRTDIGSEKKENKRISLTGGLKTWWHLQ